MLSVHSEVCGIACGLSLWAEEERKEIKRCLTRCFFIPIIQESIQSKQRN